MSALARQLEASIALATRNKAAAKLADAHALVARTASALDAHRHGSRVLSLEEEHRRALEAFHELAVVALGLEKTT